MALTEFTDVDKREAVLENEQVPTISLVGLLNILLANRRLMVGLPLVVTVAVVLLVSSRPLSWTSDASFAPESDDQQGGLISVAAQFGVQTGASRNLSPAFYVDFLRSRSVLNAVLLAKYPEQSGGQIRDRTLLDILDVRAPNHALRVEKGIRELRGRLQTDLNSRTGVVSFAFRAPDPVLAKDVVERLLGEVNRFNVERRQSSAKARRLFSEKRMLEAKTALREAEDQLQVFAQENRDLGNYSQATLQRSRLAREVSLRQQTYMTMAGAYEQASLDEVRDTPVITIVEEPVVPAAPDPRRRAALGLLALFAGIFIAALISISRTWIRGRRIAGDPEVLKFSLLREEAIGDLRALRFWRRPPIA